MNESILAPPPTKKKALTLRPYWAWAVCHAGKRVENRSWPTKYRGRLCIHAGLGNAKTDAADRASLASISVDTPEPEDLIRGAIVAEVDLVDCVAFGRGEGRGERGEGEKTPGALFDTSHLDFGRDLTADPFAFGPWCWILENVTILEEPIPLRGQLGLFGVNIPT